jgi:hypothetical protein
VEAAIGCLLIAIGLPLLFMPNVLYAWLDRSLRPLFERQARWGLRGWTKQYPWQREALRWVVPLFTTLVGALMLVSGLASLR